MKKYLRMSSAAVLIGTLRVNLDAVLTMKGSDQVLHPELQIKGFWLEVMFVFVPIIMCVVKTA